MTRLWQAARLATGLGWETGPVLYTVWALMQGLSSMLPLLFGLGVREIIDGAATHDRGQAYRGAVVCTAAILSGFANATVGAALNMRLQDGAIRVLHDRTMRLIGEPPTLVHLEDPTVLDKLELVRRVSVYMNLLNNYPWNLLVSLLQAVLGSVLLLQIVPTAIVVVPMGLLAAWIAARGTGQLQRAQEAHAEDDRQVQHLFDVMSTPEAADEVRVFGLSDELVRRHGRIAQRSRAGLTRARWRNWAFESAAAVITYGTVGVALVLAVQSARRGSITPGDVGLLVSVALGLMQVTQQLAGGWGDDSGSLGEQLRASDRYYWLAALGEQAPRTAPPVPVPARVERGIELSAVSFAYPASEEPVLDQLDLLLPAGKVIALVGENGAGKTSLAKLLLGLYVPTSGSVSLDGIDLRQFDQQEYRTRLTAGFQDFMKFELPLRESVGLGDLALATDDDVVLEALTLVGADFVADLPEGLDTQLGGTWPGGRDLSGGQWQKIAIARATMRPDPLLLIFDEPTAALDPASEHALFERVAAAAADRRESGQVTILVSHRFSTVRMADLIVVLEQGRVVEQGDHDGLMAAQGRYAELFTLQSAAYAR